MSMKKTALVLVCILSSLLLFGNESSSAPSASGYYLHGGKIYFQNFEDKSITVLDNMTDKVIYYFWLSPKQDYIVFKQETYKVDCNNFTSLGVYSLSEKKTIKTLGTNKYSDVCFQGWRSDNEFEYLEAISPDQHDHGYDELKLHSYIYTIGGKNKEIKKEYDVDDCGWMYEFEEEKDAPSINKNIDVFVEDEGIRLVNKETEMETMFTVTGGYSGFRVNAWLDSNRFFYSMIHVTTAQCDDPISDLYLYDIAAGTSTLIGKDIFFLQMVK